MVWAEYHIAFSLFSPSAMHQMQNIASIFTVGQTHLELATSHLLPWAQTLGFFGLDKY